MNLTEKKTLKLEQIKQARNMLSIELNNEFITEDDILHLLSVKNDYGFKYKDKAQTYKLSILWNIFNSPFLLCDQDNLSLNVKQIIPLILNFRYNMEINELNNMLECGHITKEEYIEEEKLIKFCYYGSSKDGKNILKTGHVENFLDNKIKAR